MGNQLQALNRSPVFAALQPQDLQLMVGAMARRQLWARQTVFDQGSPGDSMFVLAEGRLAVRYRRRDRPGLVVDEMSPGAVLGEMACLDPAPRSATADVVDDSVAYELDRNTLLSLRQHAPALASTIVVGITSLITGRLRKIDTLLQERMSNAVPEQSAQTPTGPPPDRNRVELAARLDSTHVSLPEGLEMADLELLQSAGRTWLYDHGAVLCAEGDPGKSCFLLLRGELEVWRSCTSGARLLAVLPPGVIAGQMALVDRGVRSAGLRARGRAAVVELARDDYDRLVSTATPFALRFQEQLAINGIRQLRTAIELLRDLPDPAENEKLLDDDHTLAATRFLTGLTEWNVALGEVDEVSFPEVDPSEF